MSPVSLSVCVGYMSLFGEQFNSAMQVLLDQLGDAVTYTDADGNDTSITAIFNEFVGAVDDQAQAVFTISTLASNGITDPIENDRIVIDGSTERWIVVDVRDSKDNTAELRCIRPKLAN